MEMKIDIDFGYLIDNSWSGAKDTIKTISKAGLGDELMNYLEMVFDGEIPTATEINDLLRFEPEEVFKGIGFKDFKELDTLLDRKAIEEAEKTFSTIEKDMEKAIKNGDYEDEDDYLDDNYGDSAEFRLFQMAVDAIESDIERIIQYEEKTADTDSIIGTITFSGRDVYDKGFKSIISMAEDIDSWLSYNDIE